MATITESRARTRAKRVTLFKTATAMLNETVSAALLTKFYDVFLSHAVRDSEIVLGVKLLLEDHGRSVYVDWIEDPGLDRSKVTPATAEALRARMRQCASLIYLHTENSPASKWMPWELGYFDGYKGTVAILPVTKEEQQGFAGQEYLGIYPYIDEGLLRLDGLKALRIHKSATTYKGWADWVASPASLRKTS